MYNVNYVLAKALQEDHLREAKKGQASRLWNLRRKLDKKARATVRK